MSIEPSFRFRAERFGSGRDTRSLSIQVHRIDGNPDRDAFGERLATSGVTLDDMIVELRRIIGAMGTAATPDARAEPLSWPVIEGRIVFPEVPS